jgi:hypothetical protein
MTSTTKLFRNDSMLKIVLNEVLLLMIQGKLVTIHVTVMMKTY